MPAELTPDIDPSDVAATIHDERSGTPAGFRSSGTRRTLLERYGSVLADGEIDLTFETTDGETARVELGTNPPQVYVPTWESDQPVTELPRKVFDLLIQQTLTVHEIGHVNYTDNTAFGKAKQSLPPEERPAFHRLFNVLEDGAIEEQLRSAFDVADELAVTNANYRFSYDEDDRQYDLMAALQLAGLDLAVFDSGLLGELLDPAEKPEFVDSQARKTFCKDVLPPLANAVPDVLSEPDGEQRVERVLDLWEEIKKNIDTLEPPEEMPGAKGSVPAGGSGSAADSAPADALGGGSETSASSNGTEPSDDSGTAPEGSDTTASRGGVDGSGTTAEGDEDDNSSEQAGPGNPDTDVPNGSDSTRAKGTSQGSESNEPPGVTDSPGSEDDDSGDVGDEHDTGEHTEGRTENGIDTPAPDSGDDRSEDSGRDSPSEPTDSGSGVTDEDSDPGGDEDPSEAGSDAGQSDGVSDENGDIRERVRRATEETSGRLDRQERADAEIEGDYEEAASEFIDVLDDIDRGRLTIETPEVPPRSAGDRWQGVRRDGKRLCRVFDQRLQNERRSDRRRNQRRGRLDPRALSRLERKDPRVFRSDDSPDEKEYAMILVLDRSSSMSSMIGVAERAVATLAYALESVGVDVCILDMYRSRPRVAKPFAVDIENAPETVLTGEAGGGTPLAGVLEIARKRVTDEEYYPAMITVTDGKPNDEEAYRAQLRQTRFPVLGVYVDLSARSRDRVLRRNRESGPLYDQRTIVIDESELTDSLETMARQVMF